MPAAPARDRVCLALTIALAAAFGLVALLGASAALSGPAALLACLGFAGACALAARAGSRTTADPRSYVREDMRIETCRNDHVRGDRLRFDSTGGSTTTSRVPAAGLLARLAEGRALARAALGPLTGPSGLAADGRALARAALAALTGPWGLAAAAGVLALALAVLAAALLEPWGWDALAYHLPPVHDALQTGAVRELPTHVTYARAYPQAIERVFTLWRSLLPDDRLIDLAQLPFAVAGVAGLAALLRRAGVRPGRALGLALAWLATPVVMLQLAHAYVDIAHAALLLLAIVFVTGPSDRGHQLGAALALGLLLGSKPSAPLPFALLAATLCLRADRARRRGALAAVLAAAAIGGASYVRGWLLHGNPVWPVALHLGPLTFPGPASPSMFFAVQTPPGFADLGWLGRLWHSWSTLPGPGEYSYDMRLGLHGPLHLLLPLALVCLSFRTAHTARLPAVLLLAASLATPAGFWPRFTLAVPAALLLALAAGSEAWPRARRTALDLLVGALALVGVVWAAPGFTPDGPPVWRLAAATPLQRAESATAIGQARAWLDARALVGAGESFAYDDSLDVPGLLWRPDGRGRVDWLPTEVPADESLARWFAARHVRVIALDRHGPRAAWLRARPARYQPLFTCRHSACEVFAIRPD